MRTKKQWRNYAAQCKWTVKHLRKDFKEACAMLYNGDLSAGVLMADRANAIGLYSGRAQAYKEISESVE